MRDTLLKASAVYGKIAKVRSTHNNYLTLPVVFLMLSNHYPLALATEYAWIIASLMFLTGVTIRHYFNTMHKTGSDAHWTWALTVLPMIAITSLSTAPMLDKLEAAEARTFTPTEQRFVDARGFDDAYDVALGNCSMCHAREPVYSKTMLWPPKGVVLETKADVALHASQIFLHAGVSHAMPPPGAVSTMTDENRMTLVAWYKAAQASR